MRAFYITAIVAIASGILMADTIYVPDDYSTIQAAILAASNGDTIMVSDGTYEESINFYGRNIHLISVNGPEDCVIDSPSYCMAPESVVTFFSNETRSAVLEGFTITGGYGTEITYDSTDYCLGGGIYIYDASPIITGCIITDNAVSGASSGWNYGNAIYAGYIGEPTDDEVYTCPLIQDCIIYDNGRSYWAASTTMFHGCDEGTTIKWCEIYNNWARASGLSIKIENTNIIVENNLIYDNYEDYHHRGSIAINNWYDDSVIIRNNVIDEGEWDKTACIRYIVGGNGVEIYCNTFLGCAEGYGLEVVAMSYQDQIDVYNNVFACDGEYQIVDNSIYSTTFNIDYNCIPGGEEAIGGYSGDYVEYGNNNVEEDPDLTNWYHITSRSPCKNAGSNSWISPPYYDIDGQLRANGTVDIGADEIW